MSVAGLCLGASEVLGQPAIDVSTTLELARENNPDWRAPAQEVEMARDKLMAACLFGQLNRVFEG